MHWPPVTNPTQVGVSSHLATLGLGWGKILQRLIFRTLVRPTTLAIMFSNTKYVTVYLGKKDVHSFVPLSFWKWSTSFSPWFSGVKSWHTADSKQIISEYAGDTPAVFCNRSSHTASAVFYRDVTENLRRCVMSYKPILFPIHDLPRQYFSSFFSFASKCFLCLLWCLLGRALGPATPLRPSH